VGQTSRNATRRKCDWQEHAADGCRRPASQGLGLLSPAAPKGGPKRAEPFDTSGVGEIICEATRGRRAQKACPCPRLLNLEPFGVRQSVGVADLFVGVCGRARCRTHGPWTYKAGPHRTATSSWSGNRDSNCGRSPPWSAVAAATAFRLRFILPRRKSDGNKGGSCCYRTPRRVAQARQRRPVSQGLRPFSPAAPKGPKTGNRRLEGSDE
jgi:hypothetical protein